MVTSATPSVEPAALQKALAASTQGAQSLESLCDRFCAHTDALHCGSPDSCKKGCRDMLGGAPCLPKLLAFFECGEKESLTHWECDNGIPSIKHGYCDDAQAAFFKCIQSPAGTAPAPSTLQSVE